jgi:hypothetical protein
MRWVLLGAAVVVEVTLAPTCASAKALPSVGMTVCRHEKDLPCAFLTSFHAPPENPRRAKSAVMRGPPVIREPTLRQEPLGVAQIVPGSVDIYYCFLYPHAGIARD